MALLTCRVRSIELGNFVLAFFRCDTVSYCKTGGSKLPGLFDYEMPLKIISAFVFVLLGAYIFALSRRLNRSRFQPHKHRSRPFPSEEELLKESEDWSRIDVLQGSGVDEPTNKRYLITGASGSFGVWLVQILQKRGERHIYCLDVAPLPPSIAGLEGVKHLTCNITSKDEVKRAFEIARPDV